MARPLTNLELIQNLSAQVGDTLASVISGGDSVLLVVRPAESAWFVEGSVLQALSRKGCIPTASLSATYDIELGLQSAEVRYANVRRKSFFGSRVLDRSVLVHYAAKIVNKKSGAIVLTGSITRSSDDVVEASAVGDLENAGIPATHGVLPREGFFSTLFEPFITMGAIAVAVYLLFQVRS